MKGWSTLLGIALHTPACMATMGWWSWSPAKLPPATNPEDTLATWMIFKQQKMMASSCSRLRGFDSWICAPKKVSNIEMDESLLPPWEATKISPKFQGGF